MKSRIARHAVPAAFLALPVLAFHADILLFGNRICGGDLINQFVPWRHWALGEMAAGRFPFWNPYAFCGTPFAANIQTSLFYPWNLLHALFSVEYTFSLSLAAHHLAAALGMYLFLVKRFETRGGACIGALAYAWSGFLIAHAHDGHLIHVRACAWIPFALACQSAWIPKAGRLASAGFIASLAMMFYAGHTQIPLYMFYLLFARSLWLGWIEFRGPGGLRAAFRIPALTLGGLAAAVIVSLPVLLPLYQLSQHAAARAGGADFEFAVSDSLPPAQLATLAAPFFYGDPLAETREDRFWLTGTGYHEICGYIGVLPLLLAFMAALNRKRPLDPLRTEAWCFLAVGGLALLFALGGYTPLYQLLYYGLPGWSYFRVPARLLLVWIVALSVVSAFGWREWRRMEWPALTGNAAFKAAAAASALALVAALVLAWSKPAVLAWLREFEIQRTLEAFGLPETQRIAVAAQLPRSLFEIRFGWMLWSSLLACGFLALSWLALLATKRWNRRVAWAAAAAVLTLDLLVFSHRFIETKPPGEWENAFFPQTGITGFLRDNARGGRVLCLDDAIGHPGLEHHPELRPNRLMRYGIETVRGYDPIILASVARYANRAYGRPEDAPQGGLLFFPPDGISAALPMLNEMNARLIVTASALPSPLRQVWSRPDTPVRVYENPDAKARFFWEREEEGNVIETLELLPSRAELRAVCASDNRLVWSQPHYPGWRADVDGAPAEIEPHRDLFLSVRLTAGEHRVVFAFKPSWLP